jgi:hypothetical protein
MPPAFVTKITGSYLAMTQGECNLEFAPFGRRNFAQNGSAGAPKYDPK